MMAHPWPRAEDSTQPLHHTAVQPSPREHRARWIQTSTSSTSSTSSSSSSTGGGPMELIIAPEGGVDNMLRLAFTSTRAWDET
ncbi:unnamed protein product [Lota lota]